MKTLNPIITSLRAEFAEYAEISPAALNPTTKADAMDLAARYDEFQLAEIERTQDDECDAVRYAAEVISAWTESVLAARAARHAKEKAEKETAPENVPTVEENETAPIEIPRFNSPGIVENPEDLIKAALHFFRKSPNPKNATDLEYLKEDYREYVEDEKAEHGENCLAERAMPHVFAAWDEKYNFETAPEVLPAPPAEIVVAMPEAESIEFDSVAGPEENAENQAFPNEGETIEAENVFTGFHLSGIIGQDIAVERLTSMVEAGTHGRPLTNPLVIGEAGLGKTAICKAALKDLERLTSWNTISFGDPGEFRLMGGKWEELIKAITGEYGPTVVYIDEIHKIREQSSVQYSKFFNFLMKYLDGNNEGQYIQFDDKTVIRVDYTQLAFILSTNCPDKLDKTGAFQSRVQKIELDHYSKPELVSILQLMLKAKGFQAADQNTLGIMADCGRGTARNMEKLVDELRAFLTKSTVNKLDVKTALRRCKLYPDGLSATEVSILSRITVPHKPDVLLQAFPNMQTAGMRATVGYFMAKGYAGAVTGGIQRTAMGSRYIEACKKAGFTMP